MQKCSLSKSDTGLCKFVHDYPVGVGCGYQEALVGRRYLLNQITKCPRGDVKWIEKEATCLIK